jgi:branched-chain amino acid transport system substrate-binding protein
MAGTASAQGHDQDRRHAAAHRAPSPPPGTTWRKGAKLAEEEINKQGGVLGRKIQLVIEDNKSNPTEAVATAEKLISKDKVPVLMGAWSSTLTLAVMPKLMEYQVPMLVETSSSGKITTSGNPTSSASARPPRWRRRRSRRW